MPLGARPVPQGGRWLLRRRKARRARGWRAFAVTRRVVAGGFVVIRSDVLVVACIGEGRHNGRNERDCQMGRGDRLTLGELRTDIDDVERAIVSKRIGEMHAHLIDFYLPVPGARHGRPRLFGIWKR